MKSISIKFLFLSILLALSTVNTYAIEKVYHTPEPVTGVSDTYGSKKAAMSMAKTDAQKQLRKICKSLGYGAVSKFKYHWDRCDNSIKCEISVTGQCYKWE